MGNIHHMLRVWLVLFYCMNMTHPTSGGTPTTAAVSAQVVSSQFSSHMIVKTIQRDINESIIAETWMVESLGHCSFRCAKVSSASLYFLVETQTCHCNNAKDTDTTTDSSKPEVVYAQPYSVQEVSPLRDCLEHYEAGFIFDGVYPIQPSGPMTDEVWCDMSEGGWTVIQRRQDGSENFNRGWTDYLNGFGSRSGEYWLSLKFIEMLTLEQSELKITMETFGDATPASASVTYVDFRLEGESTSFQSHWNLSLKACSTDDDIEISTGRPFSTYDNDNNLDDTRDCASELQGGWWYLPGCGSSNFNGPYLSGNHTETNCGVCYKPCWGENYSLKRVVTKIRRYT